MYERGLGFERIGSFESERFDGIMVGPTGGPYHIEFTTRHGHPSDAQPSEEDLLVFYVEDRREWEAACARMLGAGFETVEPVNGYWARQGQMFIDPDGYRVVIQNTSWPVSRTPN